MEITLNKNIKSECIFIPVCSSFQYEFEFTIKEDLTDNKILGGKNNKVFFCNIRLKK